MTPFLIFPWDVPFLPSLQTAVREHTHGHPGHSVIIVPHNRPRRYLTEFFRQDASLRRPMLLPRMLTVSEMIGLFRAQTTSVPLHTAGTLDRVALLYQCVRDVADTGRDVELCSRFANMDMARFFPWGIRLASLLEECFTQRVDAKDIPYAEGEVSPLAAALLGALGRIQERYLIRLEEQQWTTPGLDARAAAQEVSRGAVGVPSLLRTEGLRQVFIAGLAVLSNAENTLLKHLWADGAHICLHTDPALADPANTRLVCHWACADHVRWIQEWRAPRVLACPASGREPRFRFTAGYDAHSQLDALREVLSHDSPREDPPSTAVVLTDAGLLLPTLHHLPDRDFNVSMGYPLDRSPLCRLLEAILRMQATRREGVSEDHTGPAYRYHWRALLHCLRHPYLQMLGPDDGSGATLRTVLTQMEEALRGGTRFAEPHALALDAADACNAAPSVWNILQDVLDCVCDTFAAVHTPNAMAGAIGELCDLLLTFGGDTWKRYPLDAESLYRLVQGVIPQLRVSALADTTFPKTALFSLTRQLVRAQRVPFEADPIAGLQILGMLETRLLHFERIMIVDATDDALPGFTAQDPLLPDALRLLLGLPDARRRERTAAHTLYRLMAGAADVHFFWQEGIQRSSLFEGKKNRSRFVDERIWREEQSRKALLVPGTSPLEVVSSPVTPMQRQRQGLPGSDILRDKMQELLQDGISPTRLDTYLTCPARFAWEHLLRLRPVNEVNEGDDPAAVGQLVHKVLQDAYTPWLNKTLHRGDIPQTGPDSLGARFAAALEASPLRTQLPPDSYIMLATAGPLRLERYLDSQPPETCVLALEQRLRAPLPVGQFILKGTIDRVDNRDNRLLVLDYKTGHVRRPQPDVWEDSLLWRDIQLWTPESSTDPLPTLAEAFPSVQLPCYLYLCMQAQLGTPFDAAWVNLRDNGAEVPLWGDDIDADVRETALEQRIPQLLTFITTHMAHAAAFPVREGGHCAYCPFADLCMKEAHTALL